MTIQTEDLRLYKSINMNDEPNGGGRESSQIIPNGESSNVFDNISSLDRTYGRLQLRKIYGRVYTQDVDKYYGAMFIVSKLPKDSNISINLFNTNDHYDERTQAKYRIENYRARGSLYAGTLLSTQWQGSQAITIFQNPSAPLPVIGEILFLTQNNDTETQFIKISTISDSIQSFQIMTSSGRLLNIVKRIVQLEITQPLNYDFVGTEITIDDFGDSPSKINRTIVANASRYYSARPLAEVATTGDLSVMVDTVYSQIVPSSLTATAIVDADVSSYRRGLISMDAPSYIEFKIPEESNSTLEEGVTVEIGIAIEPTTFEIKDDSSVIITDNGGLLYASGAVVGKIDYTTGAWYITSRSSIPSIPQSQYIKYKFKPASSVRRITNTQSIIVTANNRSKVYTAPLGDDILLGTIEVSYLVNGEWYTLYDNGQGGLKGAVAGIGTGSFNATTGSLVLTLSSLPDADSEIIINACIKSSSLPVVTTDDVSQFVDGSLILYNDIQLQHANIKEGTLSISITAVHNQYYYNDRPNNIDTVDLAMTQDSNGVYTVTDTASDINAIAYIDTETGVLRIADDRLGIVSVKTSYVHGDATGDTKEVIENLYADSSGNISFIAPEGVIAPNTFRTSFVIHMFVPKSVLNGGSGEYSDVEYKVWDDGNGNIKCRTDKALPVINTVGTINYATGTVVFNTSVQINVVERTMKRETYALFFHTKKAVWVESNITVRVGDTLSDSRDFTFKYSTVDPTSVVTDQTYTLDHNYYFMFDLKGRKIEPYSLSISTPYGMITDNGNGILVEQLKVTAGYNDNIVISEYNKPVGDINYSSGKLSLHADKWYDVNEANSDYEWQSTACKLLSCVSSAGDIATPYIVLRVPKTPVNPLSFSFTVTGEDGVELSGSADANGNIVGSKLDASSHFNYKTGIASIYFTESVVASGNESEPWYDIADVDSSGNILKPVDVFASTLRYQAVVQSSIPLDESILGLNPVRLPEDGRVPVYRVGGVVVILNDQVTDITPVLGDVTILRTGVCKVTLTDSANVAVPLSAYTIDYVASTITWNDTSGISMPITVKDRIEDMSVVSDVQITGRIGLTSQLSHDYPIEGTLVSSAMIVGDTFAHVSTPFDQQTWITGIDNDGWKDYAQGSVTLAEFNSDTYPVGVDNASTIEERWSFVFRSATNVDVIGEHIGVVLDNVPIASVIAPINPSTGQPYFTVNPQTWGSGWSSGNVVRFNTYAGSMPVWAIMAVAQGAPTDTSDDALLSCIEMRGGRAYE